MSLEQQAESERLDAEIRSRCLDVAVACVRRELAMRKRVYPRQVAQGRMTPLKAAQEESDMQGVLRLLVEMQHGHATPAYVAALEAYGVLEHEGGRA